MPCERFARTLNDHAAGASLERRLAAHLADCARCRAALEARRHLIGDIDRELHAALDIEASSDFAARVRARIAAEPEGHAWWSPRFVVVAAVSIAVTLAVLLLVQALRLNDPAAPTRASEPAALPHGSAPGIDDRGPRTPTPHRVDASRRVSSRRPIARPALLEPEVLVPRAHAEAVRRLVHAVAEGRLELPAPPQVTSDAAPMLIPPVAVVPVAVPPIEIAAASAEKVGSR
jgi:hypothetical protein